MEKHLLIVFPKETPKNIVADYLQQKGAAKFDLKQFVQNNFELPPPPPPV